MSGNKLDTNIGGKYLKKTMPEMTKLVLFSHYFSISWALLKPGCSIMSYSKGSIIVSQNLPGDKLDTNVGVKYLKKIMPKMTKLVSFSHYSVFIGHY